MIDDLEQVIVDSIFQCPALDHALKDHAALQSLFFDYANYAKRSLADGDKALTSEQARLWARIMCDRIDHHVQRIKLLMPGEGGTA